MPGPQHNVPRHRPGGDAGHLAPPRPRGRHSRPSPPRGNQRRIRVAAVLTAVVLVVALAVLGAGRLRSWLGGGSATVRVTVAESIAAHPDQVTSLLVSQGVLKSPDGFQAPAIVAPGTYQFHKKSAPAAALAVLQAGPAVPANVTVDVPPGDRIGQILYLVNQAVPWFQTDQLRALLDTAKVSSPLLPPGGIPAGRLTTNGSPFEGLLFPASYTVTDFNDPTRLLQAMADKMNDEFNRLGGPAAAKALNLTPYELVTVASMVQSEAASADEAPKVARVIYNRLAQRKPLQIDATSVYEYCTSGSVSDCSTIDTSKLDFSSASLYNTRHQAGLPPTPISNPSEYALDAAMHPADGPWLYYVLVDPQHHFFTADYQQFLQMQRLCAQRQLGCGSG